MTRADDVSAEMARAEAALRSLVGAELSTITITSETPDEAVFLGQNISKLSPIIGNLVESSGAENRLGLMPVSTSKRKPIIEQSASAHIDDVARRPLCAENCRASNCPSKADVSTE